MIFVVEVFYTKGQNRREFRDNRLSDYSAALLKSVSESVSVRSIFWVDFD
jgi:hypothetical protein